MKPPTLMKVTLGMLPANSLQESGKRDGYIKVEDVSQAETDRAKVHTSFK